jgi:hypothetical protein
LVVFVDSCYILRLPRLAKVSVLTIKTETSDGGFGVLRQTGNSPSVFGFLQILFMEHQSLVSGVVVPSLRRGDMYCVSEKRKKASSEVRGESPSTGRCRFTKALHSTSHDSFQIYPFTPCPKCLTTQPCIDSWHTGEACILLVSIC